MGMRAAKLSEAKRPGSLSRTCEHRKRSSDGHQLVPLPHTSGSASRHRTLVHASQAQSREVERRLVTSRSRQHPGQSLRPEASSVRVGSGGSVRSTDEPRDLRRPLRARRDTRGTTCRPSRPRRTWDRARVTPGRATDYPTRCPRLQQTLRRVGGFRAIAGRCHRSSRPFRASRFDLRACPTLSGARRSRYVIAATHFTDFPSRTSATASISACAVACETRS